MRSAAENVKQKQEAFSIKREIASLVGSITSFSREKCSAKPLPTEIQCPLVEHRPRVQGLVKGLGGASL